jgi:hypothetical protein
MSCEELGCDEVQFEVFRFQSMGNSWKI